MNIASTGAEQIIFEHKRAEDLTLMGEALRLRVLWRCPTLPQPGGCSTIGAAGLSFQVRNGGWAFPRCYDHHKYWCSTRSPLWFVWGCGLIVVCIVVAAVCSLLFWFTQPLLVGYCLVLAH